MFDRYGQSARLADLIRSAPRTAETERADWTGESDRARFEGAAQADRGYATPSRSTFGKKRK